MAQNIIDETVSELFNKIYPIGSIYLSANAINPHDLFGGEWTQIQDRFLLASGSKTLGTTGGQETHNHKYAIGYRSYYNSLAGPVDGALRAYDYSTGLWTSGSSDDSVKADSCKINGSSEASHKDAPDTTVSISVVSHTTSDNAMPPFLVVSIWQRVK